MKRKLLLWLAVASISTAAWANTPSEPNYMNVYHRNGTLLSASLDEQVVLKFLHENIQVSVFQQEKALWMIDDVQKIKFSVTKPNTLSEIEYITSPTNYNIRKVFENGQVIIILNGVRYNVLGVRL